MHKNKTYTICANFSICKGWIDVSIEVDRFLPRRDKVVKEVYLCEKCSKEKIEEKKRENPTLFKNG